MQVFNLLNESATRHPNQPVIIDSTGQLTYQQLLNDCLKLANEIKKFELDQNQTVGIIINQERLFLTTLFALNYLDFVVCPIHHSLSSTEYLQYQAELGIQAVIFSGQPKALSANVTNRHDISDFQLQIAKFDNVTIKVKDYYPNAAFIRPTSGTTGKAKGVVLSTDTVINRITAAQISLNITEADRILWLLPMTYHFVVSVMLYVKQAACMVICHALSGDQIVKTAINNSVSALYGSPQHAKLISEVSDLKLPKLKWAICTAGKVSELVAQKFMFTQNQPLMQVFGIIELGLPIGNLTGDAPFASIGKILDGYQANVLDQDLQPVATNQIGKLAVKGAGLFDGYLNPYWPVDKITQQGWFLTGDLAYRDEHNNYYIAGREKAVIISAGQKIFAEEVEEVLLQHPAIQAAKVYAQADEQVGEIVKADLLLKDRKLDNNLVDNIKKHCNQRLALYKIPKLYAQVMSIEHTASGKIRR